MRPAPCLPVCLVLALAGVMPSALAQMAMKPRLWENERADAVWQRPDGGCDGADAKPDGQLPPDQRKMMQDMMAKQGVGVGAQPEHGARLRQPAEAAARGEMPASDGKCQQTITQRSATGMKFSFNCPAIRHPRRRRIPLRRPRRL